MVNVHPTATGGSKRRNFPRVAFAPDEIEDDLFQCYQCGFWNERTKIQIGDAEDDMAKLQISTAVSLADDTTVSVLEMNEAAIHGCVFCKSLNSDGHALIKSEYRRKPPSGYRG